jgi:hypothetical protein
MKRLKGRSSRRWVSSFRLRGSTPAKHGKEEDEMSQARQPFAYDQLHCMSFIQLFHLLVTIANRSCLANLEEPSEDERLLPSLPVLVAGFRYNGGEALQQRLGGNGLRLRERYDSW